MLFISSSKIIHNLRFASPFRRSLHVGSNPSMLLQYCLDSSTNWSVRSVLPVEGVVGRNKPSLYESVTMSEQLRVYLP